MLDRPGIIELLLGATTTSRASTMAVQRANGAKLLQNSIGSTSPARPTERCTAQSGRTLFSEQIYDSVQKADNMAFSLACKDAGASTCPGSFTTETRDELFEHVALHAAKSHPEMKMDEATRQHVDAAVKTV